MEAKRSGETPVLVLAFAFLVVIPEWDLLLDFAVAVFLP
jgi:hypothetical protein